MPIVTRITTTEASNRSTVQYYSRGTVLYSTVLYCSSSGSIKMSNNKLALSAVAQVGQRTFSM